MRRVAAATVSGRCRRRADRHGAHHLRCRQGARPDRTRPPRRPGAADRHRHELADPVAGRHRRRGGDTVCVVAVAVGAVVEIRLTSFMPRVPPPVLTLGEAAAAAAPRLAARSATAAAVALPPSV